MEMYEIDKKGVGVLVVLGAVLKLAHHSGKKEQKLNSTKDAIAAIEEAAKKAEQINELQKTKTQVLIDGQWIPVSQEAVFLQDY